MTGSTYERRWLWSGEMTRERAAFVRLVRVGQGRPWRAVARVCREQFGGDWNPPNDQAIGMELCERAASVLEENWRIPPWN